MTREEALKVAGIFAQADGGCHYCVEDLFCMAKVDLPEIDWDELYKELTKENR